MHPVADEYLEAIYTLRAEGEGSFAVTLADLFGVSRANASATVGRLVRDGLVRTEGRHIVLTESGAVRAEATIVRHRLTECFLIEVLGMDWAAVHEEARCFERGVTPFLQERIDRHLGLPNACPHGNPIPRPGLDAAAFLRDRGAVPLALAPAARPVRLLAISELVEQRADLLRECAERGLRPGAILDPAAETAGERRVVIVAGRRETVEPALAARIWVVADEEARER